MTVEKDITELSEEIFIRRYPEYVMNGEPLSPYYDLFASGYEIANIEKDKQIEELEAQIKKMKCCENCGKKGHICVAEEMQGKLCGKNKDKWELRR